MLAAARITTTLLKLPIGFAIALSALAGMLAAEGAFSPLRALIFALAVLGASGAAGAFNHYHERAEDRLMRRTSGRPFARGVLKPGAIWPVTFLALLAVSLVMAWAAGGSLAAFFIFLGAFTYGVVYTVWLKRRSVWNIVVGGAAGSFAVLAGAAAVEPALQPAPILLAVVMFLWTPPHFWSLATVLHKEYARAGVPMLPVVIGDAAASWVILAHTVVLVAVSLLPMAYGMGYIYLAGAIAGGGFFLQRSIELVRDPGPQTAKANFLASFVQLGLLLTAATIDGALNL